MSSGGPSHPPPYGHNKRKDIIQTKKRQYVLRLTPQHVPLTPAESPSPFTPLTSTPPTSVPPTQSPPLTTSTTPVSPVLSAPRTISGNATIPTSTSVGHTTTPQPSLDIAIPSPSIAVGDSVGDVDLALHDRPTIEPYRRGFVPSRIASQAITKSIKQQFHEPWSTWGAIPEVEKEHFWKRFKTKVQWRPEHEKEIKKNFHTKASHRLSEMFRDARIAGQRPEWIGEHVWTRLLEHWNSPMYRRKCATAQKNRISKKGGRFHTGRNITTHEHAIHMAQELGRTVFVDKVFQQTHIRRDTDQFVDEKLKKPHVKLFHC